MKIKIVVLVVIFFTFFTLMAEDKEKSITLYNSGLEKFEKNDIDGAMSDLREAISQDARNFRAKKSLVDVIVAKSKKLFETGNFSEAADLLKEAYRLYPSNTEVSDLIRSLNDGSIQQKYSIKQQELNSTKVVETNNDATEKSGIEKSNVETNKNIIEKSMEAEKKIEDIKKQISNSGESLNKELLLELNEQKKLIERLRTNYETMKKTDTNQSSKKDAALINELIKVYKGTLANASNKEGSGDNSLFLEQMKQQREFLETQKKESQKLIFIILIASFGIIVFLIFSIIIFILYLANRASRIRKNSAYYNGFSPMGMGYNQPMQQIQSNNMLQIGFEQNKNDENGSSNNDDEMYKDLIKSERLKRMHSQMKSGDLSWTTVREYIYETEKELRTEILNLVEMKLLSGEVIDGTSVLPILFPYLTEGDDYLREKANLIIRKALTSSESENTPQNRQLLPSSNTLNYKKRINEKLSDDIEDIICNNVLDLKNLMESLQELEGVFGNKERSLETAKISKGIGLTLGMAIGDVDLLYKTSIAHDFGYLMMDTEKLQNIMYKTEITEDDFEFIKGHTTQGIDFFKSFVIPQEMSDGILYHHERNDGSGYPKGLKGDSIPLFAKIIGLSETYVAITSARPHKEKLSPNEAIAIIRDGARKKFDMQHIEALISYLKKVGIIKK